MNTEYRKLHKRIEDEVELIQFGTLTFTVVIQNTKVIRVRVQRGKRRKYS